MPINFTSSDPNGLAMQNEIAALAAEITAINDSSNHSSQVLTARKADVQRDLVLHAVGTGQLTPAAIIAACDLNT
jgi:hypothetical protein